MEQVPLSTEIELPKEALKAEGNLEVKEWCRTDVGNVFLESENSKTFLPSQSARKKHPKSSKSIKTSEGKSKAPGSKNKIKNASKERVYQRKSFNKSKIKKAICDQIVTETESHQIVGNFTLFELRVHLQMQLFSFSELGDVYFLLFLCQISLTQRKNWNFLSNFT